MIFSTVISDFVDYLRAGLDDLIVTLRLPEQLGACNYEYCRQEYAVRLVRTATSNDHVGLLMT